MRFIIFLLLTAGLFEIRIGFVQWINNVVAGFPWYRIEGSFHNPGPYGGFLAMILPFALFVILNVKIRNNRSIVCIWECILLSVAWTNLVGIIMLLPITQSRSAWIAALTGVYLVVSKRYFWEDKLAGLYTNNRRVMLLICLGILVVAIVAIAGIYHVKKDSADGRLLIWKVSLSAQNEHWILGGGQGSFPGIYGNAQAKYFAERQGTEREQLIAGAPDCAYNEYLQISVEHGVVGLLVFLLILMIAFFNAQRTEIWGAEALFGALGVFLVFACFSYPLRVFYLNLLSIFVILIAVCLPLKAENFRTWYCKFSFFLFILSVLLIVCYSFGYIGRPGLKQARNYWHELRPHYYNGDFENIIENYTALYPYLSNETAFIFEYGQCLAQTGNYERSNEILEIGAKYSSDPMFYNIMGKNYQRLKQYDRAESMFQQALFRIPHRIYPLYLLMSMYFESGQLDKAMKSACEIINKNVKFETSDTKSIKKEAEQMLYTLRNR